MRVLSELWYGNIEPQDRTIPRNSEYKKLLSKICEYEETFRGIFSPEQQTEFEDYENATISVTAPPNIQTALKAKRMYSPIMLFPLPLLFVKQIDVDATQQQHRNK